ncbi:hypothetical protein [Pantoea ananatis]|uniref:hypothetical protein n=1 Tax=Pantoea ananas TaxID=553 RepID=UPI001B314308|nr:hypothetical protein [Pantoea ananatis]
MIKLPDAKVIHDGKSERARQRCEGWNACLAEVQRLNATPQPVSDGCKWSFDDDGYWSSACGSSWVFNDGGPIENECNFCQKCGGKVVMEAAPGGQDD